jgi:hypothetical protein
MIDLIRKRHEGEGWCVFTELANGTGYKVRGWADAAALGIWPSRGYELHGYEFKASREDLKKELRDPAKADNVGRYCHFWWLVLTKAELMEGLIIPATWGILVPKGRVLRVLRKAPKNTKAKPFDPAFVAAMIRNITKSWVPKHVHEALKEQQHAEAVQPPSDTERELADLRKRIADFEAAAGVTIDRWGAGQVGNAVRLVLDARHAIGREAIAHNIRMLDNAGVHLEEVAERARSGAAALRALHDESK